MVRTIDGEQRRKVLADAVWRLIRAGGLEAASVRAVAADAGLATGSVRHFFATQDQLHVFAMEELTRRLVVRVEDALEAAAPVDTADPPSPDRVRHRVRAGLLQLLPTTEESTADFHAHLQFIVKAVVHPPLADAAQRSLRELQDFYLRCVDYLARNGAAPADVDRPSATRELTVLMEGLVLRRLTAPDLLSIEQMAQVLDNHLDRLRMGAAS